MTTGAGSKRESLKGSVEGILEVYTIPAVLQRILDVVDDERSSIVDLVRAVQSDQALAARIVATANTAHYGMRRKVASLPAAALTLGFNVVRSIAVSVSVFKSADKGEAEYQRSLWRHSFRVGLAAHLVAMETGLVKKDEAFLAGLIHDIGRAILYQVYGDAYVKAYEEGLDGLLEREEEMFGATHSQVGGWFADKYKFPKDCVMALEYHHEPERCVAYDNMGALYMIAAVYLADTMVSTAEGLKGADLVVSPRHEDIISALGIDNGTLEVIKKKLDGMEDEINGLL